MRREDEENKVVQISLLGGVSFWTLFTYKEKDGFLSVITAFSFVGICLGVATLIIVMSVMGGFREELLSRIIGMKGHAMVYSLRGSLPENEDWLNKMKMTKHVTQVCPLVERQSIIISSTQTRGVLAFRVKLGISQ